MPKIVSLSIALLTFTIYSCSTSEPGQTLIIGDTLNYVVQMQFNDAGTHRVWQESDGTINSTYEFNDRGRGPEIESKIKIDKKGYIVDLENVGKSDMKGSVDESFGVIDGMASWENTAESYSQIKAGGFYLSCNSVPFEMTFLIRAILNSPTGSIDGLPGGVLSAKKITSFELENFGTIDLYAINGLDFAQSYVWVDREQNLFATVSGWQTVIRSDFKDQVKQLIEVQRPFEDQFYTDLSKKLTNKSAGNLILKNGNVFEPSTKELSQNTSVVISGGKIIEIGKFEELKNKEGEVIDVSGKTVMPGLWDMHGHLSDLDGFEHRSWGNQCS